MKRYSDTSELTDSLLKARIQDALSLCEKKQTPQYLGFLDERQRHIAQGELRRQGSACYSFFGGVEQATRVMLGIFPSDAIREKASFPIVALEVTFRQQDVLTHRDFLGALLSLGIKRTTLGDILTQQRQGFVLCDRSVAEFILQELHQIGRVGVACHVTTQTIPAVPQHFEPIRGTIASARLDCILHALLHCSRTEATCWVTSSTVRVNFEVCTNPAKRLEEGAILSVSGKGRFVIRSIGPKTKKDRYFLLAEKYL